MRYRLTIISVLATALVAAALVFVLNTGDDQSPEIAQPDLFPNGLGIVAAFTATAEAGGAALNPTALATPTSTSSAPLFTPSTGPTESVPTALALRLSSNSVASGDQITVEVSGAVPGESFEIIVGGMPVNVSAAAVDSSGSVSIEITVPHGVSGESVELVLVGTVSGANSTTLEISSRTASITISPEQPADGESITVSAEGFVPGEAVTISVSGEQVGSGIVGQDGTFSMTTGLPELPASEDSPLVLAVEGESGSAATSELATPGQSAAPSATGPLAGDGGNGGLSAELGDDLATANAESGSGIPTWVYAVLGAMAGWIGVLTLWVYRLERDREAQFKVLTSVISELVSGIQADRESLVSEDSANDDSRAA